MIDPYHRHSAQDSDGRDDCEHPNLRHEHLAGHGIHAQTTVKHVNAIPRRATLVGVAPPPKPVRRGRYDPVYDTGQTTELAQRAARENAIIAEARRELAAKYFWRAARAR